MDCMKELMRYSYMLIYKVGEYTGQVRDEELKGAITASFTIYVASI